MSNAATTDETTTPRDAATVAESWTALAAWAADELGVRLAFDGKEYRFEPSDPAPAEPASRTDSTIRRSWFRRRAPKEETPETSADDFTCESPSDVLLELVERLSTRDAPAMARPIEQPTAVHDFAHRLFEAYTLDGGRAHLAGCHLEDTPLVRLTHVDAEGEAPSVTHRYYDELGEPIDAEQASRLGLDRVAPIGDPSPRLDAGRLERMLGSAHRREGDDKPHLMTIVWAKRATGRLRFEFGDESLDAPFEGWAATLEAPPAVCPQTGVETFHLATTADGLIAAAEAIFACEMTGSRRLERDLVSCAVTGKRVADELTQRCPVLRASVLAEETAVCPCCDERVAKTALSGRGCRGCERLIRTPPQDTRLAKLLKAYPSLGKMKPWRLGETESRLIAIAGGWTGRVLLVLDHETGELVTAKRRGLFGPWRPTVIAPQA